MTIEKEHKRCNSVLVVEDDEDIRSVIVELLSTAVKPCLVLLDTVMKDSALAPIPILVVSAIADKTNTEGSIGFLKKPIDINVILQVVAQYCRNET